MARESFEITYAAHTGTCTFLLDAEGICRRIVMAAHTKRKESATASRCVGAQYVASLDATAAGCLIERPRIGSSMLFARVDERGRVSLVRTGPVTLFENAEKHDPFDSVSVKTSAPEVTPRTVRTPRSSDPDYFDASERTVRINALRAEDLQRIHYDHEEAPELTTAEYSSSRNAPPRESAPRPSSAPRTVPSRVDPSPHAHTLAAPPRSDITTDDEDDPYAPAARGVLPINNVGKRPSVRGRAAAAVQTSSRPVTQPVGRRRPG